MVLDMKRLIVNYIRNHLSIGLDHDGLQLHVRILWDGHCIADQRVRIDTGSGGS